MADSCLANEGKPGASTADLIELTVYLLRGLVVQVGIHPDQTARQRLFELWKQLVL